MKNWDLVAKVISYSRTTLLSGPPGTGKSYSAHTADLDGRKVYTVTLTPDTPAAELRGHYVPVGGEFVWRDGPVISAWRDGARLVINEIDHAGGDALSFLLAALDSPETARLTLPTNETVRPADRFQVVATMNGDPDRDLPAALRDRFPVRISIEEAHPQGIQALPEDLRDAAAGTVTADDPERRITLRAWLAYADLRGKVGAETAANAVFGTDRGPDILQSLQIARA